jgi:hypothetical protein
MPLLSFNSLTSNCAAAVIVTSNAAIEKAIRLISKLLSSCKITKKQTNRQTICLLFVLGTYKQRD